MRNLPRSWLMLIRALLVVPWMFLWIVPIVVALEMRVERATVTLVALAAAFTWWNVVRPLRSRPRTVAWLQLGPWRQYAGWLTLAGVAQFVLAFATLVLHEQLAAWRFLPKLPSGPDLIPPDFLGHALGPGAMFLAAVVITPLVEEFGCRGRMQHRLEHTFGVVPAIVIPAITFCLLHGLLVAAHHLAFALFVGWVVWRTGSIWAAVYVHALNNAAVLVLVYLARGWDQSSETLPPWLWPSAIVAGVVALAGLLASGYRIHRIAQIVRPRDGAWPKRRAQAPDLTPALRG
jgi:membrane protease YdiL (CAAX protease family)